MQIIERDEDTERERETRDLEDSEFLKKIPKVTITLVLLCYYAILSL